MVITWEVYFVKIHSAPDLFVCIFECMLYIHLHLGKIFIKSNKNNAAVIKVTWLFHHHFIGGVEKL